MEIWRHLMAIENQMKSNQIKSKERKKERKQIEN